MPPNHSSAQRILTRGGVKPQHKMVEANIALNLPNNVKKLRQSLGMVQYYGDMWSKHSEMLAPLTDLVGVYGKKKTTKKNKTKKLTLEVGSYPSTSI